MEQDNSVDRVIQSLRAAIAASPPGAQLPSVRTLVADHRVSPVTVQRALARLAADGLVEARPGRGTFVRPAPAPAGPGDLGWQTLALGSGRADAEPLIALLRPPPAGALSLSGGYLPSELQAVPLLSAALAAAARRPAAWERMPVEGLEPLRAWFAAEAGGRFRSHDVVICSGGQAAIAVAVRALAGPGAPILIESPSYIGAIAAAHAAGLHLVPVPSDAEGVDPDALADAFRRTGARLAYLQPGLANPSGAALAPERRAAVLAAAARAGAFVIEDDWARDLWLDQPPGLPLAAEDGDGHVVYIRSLTKAAAPGLRVAALCAAGAARARLGAARILDDFFVAGPLQEAALQLVAGPGWPRHLKALRQALRPRRTALADAVRARLGAAALPRLPAGGFHLWVRLPAGLSDIEVAARAARADLIVSPGRPWFPGEAPGPFLRLTYAGTPPDQLPRAVDRLAAVLG